MYRFARARGLWLAAAAVALVTTIVVASDLAALDRRVDELGPQRPVVVATRDLPIGTRLDEADLDVVHRHAGQTDGDPIRDRDDALGRIVAIPVLADVTLDARHLAPRARTEAGAVPAGKRALRVADESGLRPMPGALVDVIVALDPAIVAEHEVTTIVAAQAATVLADGRDAPESASLVEEVDDDATVLLLVTVDEAERLAFALANGRATLTLVPPEDAREPVRREGGPPAR